MDNQQLQRLVGRFEQVAIEWRVVNAKLRVFDDEDGSIKTQYKAVRERFYTEKIRLYDALRLKIPLRWWKLAKDGLYKEIYKT